MKINAHQILNFLFGFLMEKSRNPTLICKLVPTIFAITERKFWRAKENISLIGLGEN